MSHKMLYNEVKAEQHFSTLMNAAVSHELRNPLYALVGGIDTLKSYLVNFGQLIMAIDVSDEDELMILLKNKLELINAGIGVNVNKMQNCVKLIDYFVHDMLDYTILQNDNENFIKDIAPFEISECIDQIYEILEEKIMMKQIKVKISLSGFSQNNSIILTD